MVKHRAAVGHKTSAQHPSTLGLAPPTLGLAPPTSDIPDLDCLVSRSGHQLVWVGGAPTDLVYAVRVALQDCVLALGGEVGHTVTVPHAGGGHGRGTANRLSFASVSRDHCISINENSFSGKLQLHCRCEHPRMHITESAVHDTQHAVGTRAQVT